MIDAPVQIAQPQAKKREFSNRAHRWMFLAVAITGLFHSLW